MNERVKTEWSFGDFLIFTPFSNQEVAEVLGLPLRDVSHALETGALQTSVSGRDDPFGRLRLSSVWDIVEFDLLLLAGWPFDVRPSIRTYVSCLCDELATTLEHDSYDTFEQWNDESEGLLCDCAGSCQMCYLRESAPDVVQKLTSRLQAVASMSLRNTAAGNFGNPEEVKHSPRAAAAEGITYISMKSSYLIISNAAHVMAISGKGSDALG